MKFDQARAREDLRKFDFPRLFRERLGWDNHRAALELEVDGVSLRFEAVAEKRGFTAYVCRGPVPPHALRMKADRKVTASAHEHFVIYADEAAGRQVWHWVRREPGKPVAGRDLVYDVRQSGDVLLQRLDRIAVTLEEEEDATITGVAGGVRAAFDADRVTKRFYDRFKTEHAALLGRITGIADAEDLKWYASVMLNRLMFVYFIQKKGFLDGDPDYLRNGLDRV
ncbi:MAG TPA: SAM-dependent methyltransferase, partial [Candidatus Hydrogenedentes bacterium]|nr:SAM-dependent methyltransferase [Candidatus Hydrogenedentota bacterium]